MKSTAWLFIGLVAAASAASGAPGERDVLRDMERASTFMMETVALNGGFVWYYSADLWERWGEVPARRSMVWVQDPGTVGVGELMLEAWRLTGDDRYLGYAKRVADALVQGQYPAGGWHYIIDFDMPGVQKFYDDVLSKCWGWEEYYHFYGNCTFDDNVTTGATRFLMDLYLATHDPAYREPLIRALEFILEAQYPNGAWPQRYPLSNEYPHFGLPDYTSFYTFNDDVIAGNVYLLLDAWEKLGDERYSEAAHRGMDFFIISQLPDPQGGWNQQYDTTMRPVAARTYEPAGVMPGYTRDNIMHLLNFYGITGDRRYLAGIPRAIDWLERSVLPADHKANDRVTHATFYEIGTNRPLYAHREGTTIENGRYWVDYEPRNFVEHYGAQMSLDVTPIRRAYERVAALPPDAAIDEYALRKALPRGVPIVKGDAAEKLMKALDSRGAWVEDIAIPDYIDVVNNPRRHLQGISTGSFIRNMETLMNYVRGQRDQ